MDMTVQDLQMMRAKGEEYLLLDVRTEEELEIAQIAGNTHIPLHELQARVGELDAWKDQTVVVMCHHGGRSAQAAHFLRGQGFSDVRNLSGGIHAWAMQIDDEMPTY